ncbi:MAG: hypothetical protein NVS3B20_15750 [Polyangiales bacterium]
MATPDKKEDQASVLSEAEPSAVVKVETVDRLDRSSEPPVVARLMIEIRSDGSRTIARGAMEDLSLGQKVALEVEGRTPLALALSLVKSIGSLPALAKSFRAIVPAMLPGKKKRDER